MNAEEVVRLCEALLLKEKEGPLMPLRKNMKNDGERRLGLRLTCKLLSANMVNREAFCVFLRIWRTLECVDVEVINGNIFSFTFKNDRDRQHVLNGGPWSFDKALLVLEAPVGKGDIQGMQFNRVVFWIQIHNIPLLCMTSEIGQFLSGMIGEVKEIDIGKTGKCVGKYIRVRVVINVDVPLRRILRVDIMQDGKEIVMMLMYERLP
ncbi:hypothetical protein EZV62_024961 [Acer yangbiense]|uniref:DUF4283 domain-containing protein n=1 Tax=Acer yangbiense TaxID=1000413 RepID=A0A5C7GYE2_9ROSI|nr:hypothetical protein EZV62_024961 [Acer yangbiense]